MATERKLEKVSGKAKSAAVRLGTASEHRATVLETAEGEELILQRIGGNPFQDEPTQLLVGKQISASGYRLGDIFRYVEAFEATPEYD